MIFEETTLKGAFVVEPEALDDSRGLFARTFCVKEFEANGLNPVVAQCSTSFNKVKGTLRGMHFQMAPAAEDKLVRCTRGTIYDVVIDLRPGSPTYRGWFAAELSADNHRMLYSPVGFAHGFQTLEDDCEVSYQMSEYYSPEHARGLRYDDPAIGVEWPMPPSAISERDRAYPDFER